MVHVCVSLAGGSRENAPVVGTSSRNKKCPTHGVEVLRLTKGQVVQSYPERVQLSEA